MPASLTSKITRMKTVKLGFHKKGSTTSPPSDEPAITEVPAYYPQEYKSETNIYNTPGTAVVSPLIHIEDNEIPQSSFLEALNTISKQANHTQFDDVFDSFFFNDKRCQLRALFMTARLKQNLESMVNPARPISSYGFEAYTSKNTPSSPPAVSATASFSTPITSSTKRSISAALSSSHPSSSLDPTFMHSPSQQQQKSVDRFWRTVCHRLYTLNYILFVLPTDSETRNRFLRKIESDLSRDQKGRELLQRRGGMEAHFSIRDALQQRRRHSRRRRRKTLLEDAFEAEKRNGGNVAGAILPSNSSTSTNTEDAPLSAEERQKHDRIVEKARYIIEQCLDSEARLNHQERDAMYMLHGMRAGLMDAFELHIDLEEDRALRHRLKRLVERNRTTSPSSSSSSLLPNMISDTTAAVIPPPFKNPFEDEDLIVTEEDESSIEDGGRF